jgi:prophage antirepressor-like protein
MTNNLLEHPQFGQIRVGRQGENFIFCAKDVCDVLGIEDPHTAVRSLDDDEKGRQKTGTPGGSQELLFITESGLYALIIRSHKPEARKFRKWITSEVIPSLRKYGMYSMDAKVMSKVTKRAEEKAVKLLLGAINQGLSATDKRLVARQCHTDEYEVFDVLNRRKDDAYMLTLLYGRATGNKLLRESFYTHEGAERLLGELKKQKNGGDDPYLKY